MSEALLNRTTSLCGRCKRSLSAEIWAVDGRVLMRKSCQAHGIQEVPICADADWYTRVVGQSTPLQIPGAPRASSQGCPFDCGLCEAHQQPTLLPIVPITSACDQQCPICYTHNRNESPYQMEEAELRRILHGIRGREAPGRSPLVHVRRDGLALPGHHVGEHEGGRRGREAPGRSPLVHVRERDPQRRMVNLTGGEPTLHPQFLRMLELCREEGIRRITLSTHGFRFLKDEYLLERLAELDARIILSLDSLRPGPTVAMLGSPVLEAKLKVVDLLEQYGLNTTLLPVIAKGVNDQEMGDLVRLAMAKPCIRSVEFHTMTFTGQGGQSFPRRSRMDPFEALSALEATSDGWLRVSDFVPHPSAHPLCYQVTYLLALDNGTWMPFPRFMEPEVLRNLLKGGLYLEPGMEIESALQDTIQRLWAGEISCEAAEAVLRTLRILLDRLFAQDLDETARLRIAEGSIKAIYLHAHMDEETFDTDRIHACPVSIQEADGTSLPSCSYNVLVRERDPRFARS